MPCFEPVLMMAQGVFWSIMAGAKALHAVDHAPEIGLEDRAPARRIAEHLPAALGAGIVHQHGHLAEGGVDLLLEGLDILRPADIGRDGQHIVRLAGNASHLSRRPLERVAGKIRKADLHAEFRETFGGGEPDAACGPGDDGDAIRGDCGMLGHRLDPSFLLWRCLRFDDEAKVARCHAFAKCRDDQLGHWEFSRFRQSRGQLLTNALK